MPVRRWGGGAHRRPREIAKRRLAPVVARSIRIAAAFLLGAATGRGQVPGARSAPIPAEWLGEVDLPAEHRPPTSERPPVETEAFPTREPDAIAPEPRITTVKELPTLEDSGVLDAASLLGFEILPYDRLHPSPTWLEERLESLDVHGARSLESPAPLSNRQPRSWVNRKLLQLTERLERRLGPDPHLRELAELDSSGDGRRREEDRHALVALLIDKARSALTDMARGTVDPWRDDVRLAFFDEPLIRWFMVDSAKRHRIDPDAVGPAARSYNDATSLTLVRAERLPLQGLAQTLADSLSAVVPGEIDFKGSISARRCKVGASLQPLVDTAAPPELRSLTFKCSRELRDYLGESEPVDRIGAWMDCFSTPRSSGRLFLEKEHSRTERSTRFGFSLVCRF